MSMGTQQRQRQASNKRSGYRNRSDSFASDRQNSEMVALRSIRSVSIEEKPKKKNLVGQSGSKN